jgi:aspartate/methionine/tyrosine aminotransferase
MSRGNSRSGKALERVHSVVKESQGSPIRALKRLMEERADVLSLAMGEATFGAPQELIEAAARALEEGKNLYTSTNGIPAMREAVADFAKRRWDVDVDPETSVLMTVGGMEAIHLAFRIVVEEGDEVLLPDPGWGMMRTVAERRGARLIYYPLARAGTWTYDVDAILERMTDRTKLVCVNSPSNPTGAVLSAEDWPRLTAVAREKGVFILSDDVYHNFVYDGSHSSALSHGELENLIVVNSFSKTFAVTGWRLGHVIAHPWLIHQMGAYKESISLCSLSIGQWAMSEFLAASDGYLDWSRALCRDNMQKMIASLKAVPGVSCPEPQGGFYVFLDTSALDPSSAGMTEYLWREGVAVVPGGFFGSQGEGCLRLGFAAPWEEIEPALARLQQALAKKHG